MKSSFTIDNEEHIFEVLYTYQKGMNGDGWLTPDDPDELDYEKINLIGKINDDGSECFFKVEVDVKHLLSNKILNIITDQMHRDLEEKDYFR